MIDRSSLDVEQPIHWEDIEPLYEALYRRDSSWAYDWQIHEATAGERSWFESLDKAERTNLRNRLLKRLQQTPNERFADWLRAALDERGWNQSDLARAIGSFPSAVSKWIRAQQRPRSEQCARIAEALKIDVNSVLRAASHLPTSDEFHVEDWLVESEVRGEIVNLLSEIPESILLPLIPMLRSLADPEVARVTTDRVRNALENERVARTRHELEGDAND